MAAVNLPTAIGGRRRSPDRRSQVDWLELILASTLVTSEMKTLLLTATALAVPDRLDEEDLPTGAAAQRSTSLH